MDYEFVDISSMNGDLSKFAFYLDFVKITRSSIYAQSPIYGDIYRIELKTSKVFKNGKQIAEFSSYSCY